MLDDVEVSDVSSGSPLLLFPDVELRELLLVDADSPPLLILIVTRRRSFLKSLMDLLGRRLSSSVRTDMIPFQQNNVPGGRDSSRISSYPQGSSPGSQDLTKI